MVECQEGRNTPQYSSLFRLRLRCRCGVSFPSACISGAIRDYLLIRQNKRCVAGTCRAYFIRMCLQMCKRGANDAENSAGGEDFSPQIAQPHAGVGARQKGTPYPPSRIVSFAKYGPFSNSSSTLPLLSPAPGLRIVFRSSFPG